MLYCPFLRMKAGELEGVRELSPAVAPHVLPRFVVPPAKERALHTYLPLGTPETPDVSLALAAHWRGRPILLDTSYMLDEYGRDKMLEWYPQMLDRARSRSVQVIPTAFLSDVSEREKAFRSAIATSDDIKFALCIAPGDIERPGFAQEILKTLERLGTNPTECVVIADFAGSEFSNLAFVRPIILFTLNSLREIGRWKHIVFQGTSFPEKNKAAPGDCLISPRNEWLAWRRAVEFDPSTAEYLIFGDYAADSSKVSFEGGRAVAIRHLRYLTGAGWIIQRGTSDRGHADPVMRAVCRAIVEGGHFAGSDFSTADARIWRIAQGMEGSGTPTTWRQLNTTHHITHVVADVAQVKGISIGKLPIAETQLSFLV